jgi:hypothetical protein
MTLGIPRARLLPLLLACAAVGPLRAQQLIGYVNTRDAETTGVSDVLDGQAVLTGSASVTARDHTAPITLGRGGTVRVCQTSVLHLTESKTPVEPAPILFSLDRGAIEIQTEGAPNDAIMTPDLRFSVHNAGLLDLRLRIARNGDTCVDNRGPGAPTLAVSDPFGEAMYEVAGGQHVLFEHGSLHEVVDNETSPCGCPEEKGMSIADAMLASPNAISAPKTPPPAPPAPIPAPVPTLVAPAVVASAPVPPAPQPVAPVPAPAIQPAKPATVQTTPPAAAPAPVPQMAVSRAAPSAPPVVAPAAAPPVIPEQTVEQAAAEAAARAAALHPFPTAISEGLAPPAEAPPPVPGAPPAPATDALSYNAPIAPTASSAAPSSLSKKAAEAKASPAPATPSAPPPNDLVHVIGRFFRKLFGGG